MFEYIIFSFLIVIKLLLIGTDPSTDFEVHRNWKALTNNLSINRWYYDETSEWTLDYPPIFAYMEFFFGKISKLFDPNITKLDNLNYLSTKCLLFQRLTVVIGDILIFISLMRLSEISKFSKNKRRCLLILISGFAGLIMVDNMHFQYNSILYGILFFSITSVLEEKYILGAMIYTFLLNMKHIFIYLAPAYFVYYLKYFVFKDKKFQLRNLIVLGTSIISVFFFSFSPFIYFSIKDNTLEPILQIFRRLFPFGRGLLHSYWAPNFWAIYSFLDKIIFFIASVYLKHDGSLKQQNFSSLGLTQITEFNILPNVSANRANLIVVLFTMIFILKSFFREKYYSENNSKCSQFLNYLIISSLIFFNFGYQVHEKAFMKTSVLSILYYIYLNSNLETPKGNIPEEKKAYNCYSPFLINLIISLGVFAQMPLIHSTKDYPIKLILVVLYIISSRIIIDVINRSFKYSKSFPGSNTILNVLTCLNIILDFIVTFSPHINLTTFNDRCFSNNKLLSAISSLKDKYQFLPLMMFSVINAFVVQVIFVMILFSRKTN